MCRPSVTALSTTPDRSLYSALESEWTVTEEPRVKDAMFLAEGGSAPLRLGIGFVGWQGQLPPVAPRRPGAEAVLLLETLSLGTGRKAAADLLSLRSRRRCRRG